MAITAAEVAARIHYDMVTDERNGYSWDPRWGGDHPDGSKTLTIDGRKYTYKLGSYDCSSSVITACKLALQYTAYKGALDSATYTGNMRSVFVGSGLFRADRTAAKRGDVYLNDNNHTAMCQDGGSDGVFGYDALSEFSINENGGVYGGRVGDQTGRESKVNGFYEYPWLTCLHWAKEVVIKSPDDEKPKPTPLIAYRAHVEKDGWQPWKRDGETAGTEGRGLRMEAIQLDLPEGVELSVAYHLQGAGDVTVETVKHGMAGYVLGTTGEKRRMEAVMLKVKRNDGTATKGKRLQYRVHQQTYGWTGWVDECKWAGRKGEAKRLEAIQIRFV